MHDVHPLRVYLDTNVLFSASRSANADFLKFWKLARITPVVSPFVLGEIANHIESADHRSRLDELLRQTATVGDGPIDTIPRGIILVEKDRPILASALFARVDYLVTGDFHHFGHLHNTRVLHLNIVSPRGFLTKYASRLIP
ncbi:Predicted nucleic acid-binding protein, contains PIN domain [Granulicella rosea]|uniref:Predicted nucleic acid-binding protein, contains PIN domain n=1 Tax=Granulicella rosea TaxID=474952 RepID=A0A239KLZ1_9BACT|nr:Predicted nucleic acid-binding protein, contains PIN domain [Granulicella rosea]